jgi:DNA-binding transcriptional ArsR family regulator
VSERHFDRELDRLVQALDESEARTHLMAMFVTGATPLADIARTLDLDLPSIGYHSNVLESLGAIERRDDGRWAATGLGITGDTEFTGRG